MMCPLRSMMLIVAHLTQVKDYDVLNWSVLHHIVPQSRDYSLVKVVNLIFFFWSSVIASPVIYNCIFVAV